MPRAASLYKKTGQKHQTQTSAKLPDAGAIMFLRRTVADRTIWLLVITVDTTCFQSYNRTSEGEHGMSFSAKENGGPGRNQHVSSDVRPV
jgi:hypothetical protein